VLGVAVLLVVLGALVAAFTLFFLYSRTPAWRGSEVRMATMRLLVVIGPMFGVRLEMPPGERPAVMEPGPDPPEDGGPATMPRRSPPDLERPGL
jgi:hypothetical protein